MDDITLEFAERLSLDQFAKLPLIDQENIVRQYAGAAVRLSERPHLPRGDAEKCPKGHLYEQHGSRRTDGTVVCLACRRERERQKRMNRKAA